MRIELKSNCCGADVSINGDREQFENACFYTCNTCSKPCDGVAQEMKRAGEKASCDYGMNPSEKAYKCARYEQCDECYGKDNPPQQGEKECGACEPCKGRGFPLCSTKNCKYFSGTHWELEFADRFLVDGIIPDGIPGKNLFAQELKDYIRTLLADAERTAVRKCLEGVKEECESPSYVGVLDSNERRRGYQIAIDEITALLDTKLKNLG